MEIKFTDENTIELDKEFSVLDKLAVSVFSVVGRHAKYVIMSWYVAILFGRTRVSEDIDAFVEKMDYKEFVSLCADLEKAGMWFVNSTDKTKLFGMLEDGLAVRIAEHGDPLPNIEIKFPLDELDYEILESPLTVIANGSKLLISRIEQQIAYKFYLGTEKDLEDAIHLFEIFKENLSKDKLRQYGERLGVAEDMKKQGVFYG